MNSIIAVIFDYDDTIVPDSTTQLLENYGIDSTTFWEVEFKKLVGQGYNPTNAYLRLILDNIGDGKPFNGLTNKKLREFGAKVQKTQYPGLHDLIRDLKKIVKANKDTDIEFYIVSSGLEEVIKGNKFIEKNFSGVYGCQLAGDDDNSPLRYIKRSITFTEKTRYVFEINKGITPQESVDDPFAVNRDIKTQARRIPFKNMIYIGDGLTDIPCFSLVNINGGVSYGILDMNKTASAKMNTFRELLKTKRVLGTYAPKYGRKEDLGGLIRLTVQSRCSEIIIEKAKS
jgi:2-hydroxy-3-keto-5-methylthiopentenyl-1-phosphate phosphatase